MSVQLRAQEKSIRNNELYTKLPGKLGERVFSVIPPFAITALMTKGHGVIKNPDQFWTCSTVWRDSETARYEELVIKLLEERKVACIGRINLKLRITFSKEGIKHLEEMVRKYEWNTNISW
ncbi:unnamed protein product [marine sediment metagenome]|uniref:Uncharacterized protein n=1 Tax=marine sediment metagenome TaxID=412755 RepID=X1FIX2_9ZZZZ